MAIPLTRAVRALANEYREQAAQIQTVLDTNLSIMTAGFVDQDQYRLRFPRSLVHTHEDLFNKLLQAKNSCMEMGDLLDLWANDIERAVLEAVHSAATDSGRRPSPY